MATQSVIQSQVRDGYAVLTPQVFRTLDIRTRKLAGAAMMIKTLDEMDGDWGSVRMMSGDVFVDVRLLGNAKYDGPVCNSARIIDICNQVKVADFQNARRPEIDLAAIPAERIYDYIVWHEMGHLLDNFDHLAFFANEKLQALAGHDEARGAHHRLNEVLADRFAWEQMFPGRPLPVRQGQDHVEVWTQEWEARLAELAIQRGPRRRQRMSAKLWASVPVGHVCKGIPWSKLIKCEEVNDSRWLTYIKRAQIDVADHDLRAFRARAEREAARWARIATASLRDVRAAMKSCKEGIPLSGFLFEDEKRALIRKHRAAAEAHA